MKKVLFALFVISASTFTIQESRAEEDEEQKYVCCDSKSECNHPTHGCVELSTLTSGTTCTV